MSRLHRWAALLSGFALLSGCGTIAEVIPEETPPPVSEDLCKGATGSGPKVGIAYGIGGRDDHGLNDLAFAGLTRAVRKLDATCVEGEAAEGELESARAYRLEHLIDAGARVIVALGSDYAESVDDAAVAHPRIRFALVDGAPPTDGSGQGGRPNVAYLEFDAAEASYVAGVASALGSKTKRVGFVGDTYADAFRAGAKAAVADVEVATPEPPPTPTADPVSDAESAATQLFDAGADVVFGAPEVVERGLLDAAVEAGDGRWVVGFGTDQWVTANDDQREHVLTSIVKRYDTATYNFLSSVALGSPLSGPHVLGLQNKGLRYATSGGYVKTIASSIDDVEARIVAGDLVVPTR